MAADFNLPTVSNEYNLVPAMIRDNDSANATAFETDTAANKPVGAKQIGATGILKRWDGNQWVTIADSSGHIAATGTAVHGLGTASTRTVGGDAANVLVFSTGADATYNRWPIIVAASGVIANHTSGTSVLTTDVNGEAASETIADAFNRAFSASGVGSNGTGVIVARSDHNHSDRLSTGTGASVRAADTNVSSLAGVLTRADIATTTGTLFISINVAYYEAPGTTGSFHANVLALSGSADLVVEATGTESAGTITGGGTSSGGRTGAAYTYVTLGSYGTAYTFRLGFKRNDDDNLSIVVDNNGTTTFDNLSISATCMHVY